MLPLDNSSLGVYNISKLLQRGSDMKPTENNVLIAMSGGVDSAVAALIMQNQGYQCAGATMLLHQKNENASSCGTNEEIQDAERVAKFLGLPFHVLDFSNDFRTHVIDYFVSSYEKGETPNPCIECNRYMKFDLFLHAALELGYSKIATGHYARIEYAPEQDRYLLKKAIDPSKDQSYVLWRLRQDQLSLVLFPLGGMTKAEARTLAEKAALPVAHKSESQDICFIPNGKYVEFLEGYRKKEYPAGDFVKNDGTVLGRHKGIVRYTIGQKKGLGLVLPEPLYVCALNIDSNTVVLGRSEELFTRELTAREINLLSVDRIEGSMRVKAKVRYRHQEEWATVTQPTSDTLHVVFDEPQRAITKGQSVVLYDGDTVVGGGIIQ